MNWKLAAVLEPKTPRHRAIAARVARAGLKVSKARAADELTAEDVVIVGPSHAAGARVAQAARERLPEAFVMAAQEKGFRARWADAVLPLPVSVNDLKVRLAELSTPLQPVALPVGRPGDGILDPTTNFYTFAHFKEVLFVEVKRARRYGFPLALALIAFDPVEGRMDEGLQAQLMGGLALSIRRSLRDTDYPVQYSPDRVLLLMPHTDLAGSLIVARRICERVAKATLQSGDLVIRPTISVGVAAGEPGTDYAFSDLVRQASDGLTAAMARGGNRVEFFTTTDARREDAPAGERA